ncbi:transposase [Desulfolutivibrio sulfoxidireducens]|uniref:transposase n=1 Tax=Desulfolutivibrio sulfoxidireducens TaxID=2773299 RepID=UPI00159DC6C6|nr:transposase [Desulfolutivibrio sulfoxidireducens]QLA18679.1 transposase [Desulfolutivibrio sulfoxidireducens]
MKRPAPLSSLDAKTLRDRDLAADTLDALCARAGDHCPRCRAVRYYVLRDGRRRCSACGYTFTSHTGRFIDRCRLGPASWLRLLDHFADGLSVQDAADTLKIKYDTAHKAYAAVRLALLCDCLDARPLLDERGGLIGFCPNLAAEGLQALCGGCRSYVFSLARLHGDRVTMRLAEGLSARETLASPLRKKPWGPMVYTDRSRHHDALVFSCCRRGREMYLAQPFRDAVHLDAWPFKALADAWFARHRAFAPEAYPLYLAEAVFRHNHRDRDLSPRLAELVCRFVPKRGDVVSPSLAARIG